MLRSASRPAGAVRYAALARTPRAASCAGPRSVRSPPRPGCALWPSLSPPRRASRCALNPKGARPAPRCARSPARPEGPPQRLGAVARPAGRLAGSQGHCPQLRKFSAGGQFSAKLGNRCRAISIHAVRLGAASHSRKIVPAMMMAMLAWRGTVWRFGRHFMGCGGAAVLGMAGRRGWLCQCAVPTRPRVVRLVLLWCRRAVRLLSVEPARA